MIRGDEMPKNVMVRLSPETKKLLDADKVIFGQKTLDGTIKRLHDGTARKKKDEDLYGMLGI